MLQAIILVLIVTAVLVWLRRSAATPVVRERSQAGRPHGARFHCVEVSAGLPSCTAVRGLGNVRFLSGEAPTIPVPGCDAQQCNCRYVHHGDRRADDRRNPYGQWSNLPTGLTRERRRRVERRQSGRAVEYSIEP